jgi:hypothetical protein
VKTLVLVVVLGVLFVAAVAFAARIWFSLADVETSIHMWIALTLGATISFALGAGLMALSFHSHKHGHDDIDVREE